MRKPNHWKTPGGTIQVAAPEGVAQQQGSPEAPLLLYFATECSLRHVTEFAGDLTVDM